MFKSSLSSRWTIYLQNFVTTEDKTKKKEEEDEGKKLMREITTNNKGTEVGDEKWEGEEVGWKPNHGWGNTISSVVVL